jgi:hypothetical protein
MRLDHPIAVPERARPPYRQTPRAQVTPSASADHTARPNERDHPIGKLREHRLPLRRLLTVQRRKSEGALLSLGKAAIRTVKACKELLDACKITPYIWA